MDGHELQTVASLGVGLSEKRIDLLAEPTEIGEVGALLQAVQQIEIRGGVFESGFIFHAGGPTEAEPDRFDKIAHGQPAAAGDGLLKHR